MPAQRTLARPAVWFALCLVATVLAGCEEEGPGSEVTVTQADVLPNSSTQRHLDCGSSATLQVQLDADDSGSVTVQVRDGSGIPVAEENQGAGPATAFQRILGGSPGTWTLTVHRSLERAEPFDVTLRC